MSQKEQNDGFFAGRPALIFSWRRSFRRRWSIAAAVMLVTPIIVGLFAAIHVRGFSVPSGHLRRAEMLVFVEDPSSRDWLEKISQQTPFPVLLEKDRIESLSAPVWEEIASMKYQYCRRPWDGIHESSFAAALEAAGAIERGRSSRDMAGILRQCGIISRDEISVGDRCKG
jgi:hypothetical protein